MTSLDDQLHELFSSAHTPVDRVAGDIDQVRSRARFRQVRRRAAGVLATAAVVVAGGVALVSGGDGDSVRTGPVTQPSAPTTDLPPSTTSRPPSSTTTSSSTPSTSTSQTEAPSQPSIRDADFANRTYPAPCPAFDGRAMTLSNGTGENVVGAGASVQAELGPVGYGDADGDGDEEALVLVECVWAGADSDSGLLAVVYQIGANGQPEQLGQPLTLEHTWPPSIDGLSFTVAMDVYAEGDAACCPSQGAEQTWRFSGSSFQQISTRSIPPPGSNPPG